MHTSGGLYLPCMYQVERDLCQMIPIEIRYQLKVFEVKNTWYTKVTEHIAYELRNWKIKFNRAWLNIHESTLLYLITLVELLIHIESEQHSLRVLTPERDYKR